MQKRQNSLLLIIDFAVADKRFPCFFQTFIWSLFAEIKAISDEEKKNVEDAVLALEEAIASENVESIESSTKDLNDVLTPLTQKLYKQETPEGQPEPDSSSDEASENTVDAEFEEVKEEEK